MKTENFGNIKKETYSIFYIKTSIIAGLIYLTSKLQGLAEEVRTKIVVFYK
jgi:hypothetical protein